MKSLLIIFLPGALTLYVCNQEDVKYIQAQFTQQIQKTTDNWAQKFLNTAKALQRYLSFNCLAVKFKALDGDHFSGFALLRIGLDEYQVIGFKELCTSFHVRIIGCLPGCGNRFRQAWDILLKLADIEKGTSPSGENVQALFSCLKELLTPAVTR